MASHLSEMPRQLEQVRYLPCPVCASMMNRVNFAHCSHVIVDVCREHGTWFDRDELRQIVEFIRAGGLNQARAIEAEELKSEVERLKESRQRLQTGTSGGGWSDGPVWGGGSDWSGAKYEAIGLGVCMAAQVLKTLFRR
jgi:Zn-finger nucleic acid-binding protein